MKDKASDRDDAVDRLLPGTLKARAETVPDAECLDSETLAAWADGALDARERFGVEAHAADCARCQALLAAMVTTMPAAAAASPSRLRAFWWLAAAMTPVAAALVIWFVVPQRELIQQSQSAETAAAQPPAAPAEQNAAAPGSAAARPTPSADAQAKVKTDAPADALARIPDPAALEKKDVAAPGANAVAEVETRAKAQAAAPVPNAAAMPAAPAAADTRREMLSAPARVAGFASALDSLIVSSNPSTRFRLLPGGGVQRTADAGATWRTESTGASDTLIAGSSPSPSVCWLVGRAGTVLLSTDGRSWSRLAFPEAVDLRAVTAADHETATVTTADGRAFVTTDAGRTWSRPPDF